jgi:recombinational DNA repair protein RecR
MSDPTDKFIVNRKKVKMSEQICVFCMNLVNDYVCHECNDYKGLMPLRDAKSYLGETFPEEYLELV